MNAWMISTVLLWGVVLALVMVVLALARQIGVLYGRIAPVGALTMDKGPEVGQAAPQIEVADITGRPLQIGVASARSRLLFFLSPTCPVCKKLLPVLKSVAATEKRWLDVILASDGEMPEHLAFIRRARLESFQYLLSGPLGMQFHISKLPYAVLLDEGGTVRAKGLINTREQLESLFTARELGVASLQEYLERQAPASKLQSQESANVMAG